MSSLSRLTKVLDPVEGWLEGEARRGIVLISHGAGGNANTPLLLQTAGRLAELGFLTLRWNFGYATRGGAPSAGGKREIPEMNAAIDFLSAKARGANDLPIVLVGKSFGARVSTFLAAQRSDVNGFVFYGLPLVGAGKNAKPRDWSHLAKLSGKVLFITGLKDTLCPLNLLAGAQQHLTVPFESETVPGDHSFKPGGEELAIDLCIRWVDDNFRV